MTRPLVPHEDRLFPADPAVRGVARPATEPRRAEHEACEGAADLAYNLPKRAYKLDALQHEPSRASA